MSVAEFLAWLWGERLWLILLAAVPVLLIFALFINLHNSGTAAGDAKNRGGPPRR